MALTLFHLLDDPRHARVLVEVSQRHRAPMQPAPVLRVRDDERRRRESDAASLESDRFRHGAVTMIR